MLGTRTSVADGDRARASELERILSCGRCPGRPSRERCHAHPLGHQAGNPKAADELLPLVYGELRRLAAQRLALEKPGQTLQPTALVHEAYLRLVGSGAAARWDGCGHLFAAAAEAMRRILVEQARRKRSHKRGGGRRRDPADLDALLAGGPAQEVLALHEALEQLAAHDPMKAKRVEMRFFAGLTLDQAAECLGISPRAADRAWRYARAWLYTAMAGQDSGEK
jgi:RNA polymerase sigma factor (TIGR02999 family)